MAYRTQAERTLQGLIHRVTVTVTTERRAEDLLVLDGKATLQVSTGACHVQTYASADDCRALARGLLAAAADLDLIDIERAIERAEHIPVGEATEILS